MTSWSSRKSGGSAVSDNDVSTYRGKPFGQWTQEDRREWAEEHGFQHGTCRLHGPFWNDADYQCPRCPRDEAD